LALNVIGEHCLSWRRGVAAPKRRRRALLRFEFLVSRRRGRCHAEKQPPGHGHASNQRATNPTRLGPASNQRATNPTRLGHASDERTKMPGRRLLLLPVLSILACGAPRLHPLPPGASAAGPPAGLGRSTAAAQGVLTYAVAFAGPERLAAIELSSEFTLVVRELDQRGQPHTRHRIALGPPDFDIGSLAVDRTHAWIASRDGTARSYDLASGALALTWHLGSPATAVAVSADGQHVATATHDGILCLRRRADGALLQCVAAHEAPIAALAFAPGRLASAAWDGTVIVWDVPSLAIHTRQRFAGSVNDLAFAPDGSRLALARSQTPPVRSPAQPAHTTAAEPLALISLWDLRTHKQHHLHGHRSTVTAVAWTPDGHGLVSASWDRSVRLWNITTGTLVARHNAFSALVRDVAVHPRGAWVAAGAWSDARRLQESTATALIQLLYDAPSRRTVQASD
jgi:hypothetical protein